MNRTSDLGNEWSTFRTRICVSTTYGDRPQLAVLSTTIALHTIFHTRASDDEGDARVAYDRSLRRDSIPHDAMPAPLRLPMEAR